MAASLNIKEEAKQLVDRLSDDADWDEVLEAVRVRRAIERGLRDAEQGKTVPLDEARRRLGLNES